MNADAPFVLLPYQQRWLNDMAPVRVVEKSRRVGLSWAQAAESTLLAARATGMDTWYVGYNKDMAQEFIRDCGDWAKNFNIAVSAVEEGPLLNEDKDILAFRVTFNSGFRITALSSRPSNLRGKQGLVVIDEAAFHHDLEDLLKAAMALVIWGGRVCVISTHYGVNNPFNELIGEIRAGKVKKDDYSLHRITLDDALVDGLYKRICLTTKDPKTGEQKVWSAEAETEWRASIVAIYRTNADEELFCIPSQSGGRFLPRSLVEAQMVDGAPVIPFSLPDSFVQLGEMIRNQMVEAWLDEYVLPILKELDPNGRHYYGMDFGRSGDLSVLAPLAEDAGLHRRVPFLLELRNVPFQQQAQILYYVADRLPNFMAGAMDARGNGQFLAEVAAQRYGFTRIKQVMLSIEWYRDNMPKYKAALEDDQLTLPRHADLLADHGLIQVINGVPKFPDNAHTKGSDGGQRHGDAAMACVLAWHANGLNVAPIEFQSSGALRPGYDMDDYAGGMGDRRNMTGW